MPGGMAKLYTYPEFQALGVYKLAAGTAHRPLYHQASGKLFALAARAKYLVTRDDDLLVLGKPFGMQIITPGRFLLVRPRSANGAGALLFAGNASAIAPGAKTSHTICASLVKPMSTPNFLIVPL